jgi:hypothetical protein
MRGVDLRFFLRSVQAPPRLIWGEGSVCRRTIIRGICIYLFLLTAPAWFPSHVLAERSSSEVVKPPDVSAIPAAELERWVRAKCLYDGPRRLYEACVQTIASRLPSFDKNKPDHFGERYSPTKYLDCRLQKSRAELGCERFALHRFENPIFWPNARVPMPKLPDAPKESVYRPWMTKKQYFEALCKSEAGEFIYKTVDGVEGIYQIRPRALEKGDMRQEDRYVLEDPYGYEDWEARSAPGIFVKPNRYGFLEVPSPSESSVSAPMRFHRYYRKGGAEKIEWDIQTVSELQSRYGFLWRGIKRPRDREHNIGGGELFILDLHSGEVLATKRGFILGGPIPRSHTEIYWRQGKLCSGDSTRLFRTAEFIARVLKPLNRGGS